MWHGKQPLRSYALSKLSYKDTILLGFNPFACPSYNSCRDLKVNSGCRFLNHLNHPRLGMPSLKGVQCSCMISTTFLLNSKMEIGCAWSYISNIHFTSTESSSSMRMPWCPFFRLIVLPCRWSLREDWGNLKFLAAVAIWHRASTATRAAASWKSDYVLVQVLHFLWIWGEASGVLAGSTLMQIDGGAEVLCYRPSLLLALAASAALKVALLLPASIDGIVLQDPSRLHLDPWLVPYQPWKPADSTRVATGLPIWWCSSLFLISWLW